MNLSRVLPDLQCSLLCEDVRQESNGNFILIGVASFIRVPQLPVVAFKIAVFNRWVAGVGNFTETVRLLAPDQTTVMRQAQVKFALENPVHNATNLSVFAQVEFAKEGIYHVEVLVDDVMKLRYPLPVVVVPQQGAPDAPASPEKAG